MINYDSKLFFCYQLLVSYPLNKIYLTQKVTDNLPTTIFVNDYNNIEKPKFINFCLNCQITRLKTK